MSDKFKNQSGYIALISAIVISLVLITITVIVNLNGYLGRFNIIDYEFKETSVGLAEACVDTAILQVLKGDLPSGCTKINVGTNFCHIILITGTTPKTIKTQGIYNNSYTNLEIAFTAPNTVNYWKEYANQTPCP